MIRKLAVVSLLVITAGCNDEAQEVQDMAEYLQDNFEVERFCAPGPPAGGGDGCGVGITTPLNSGSTGSWNWSIVPIIPIDPDDISLDLLGSNITIPLGAEIDFIISALNSSGNIVATQTFAGQHLGGKIKLSNPSQAQQWLQANASVATDWSFNVIIHEIEPVLGLNTALVTLEYKNYDVVTAGTSWTDCDAEYSGPQNIYLSLCDQ